MSSKVVALTGGVGGAKLADGLARVLEHDALTIIVNTADDFRHLGLWISPDIDSVVYALAALSDPVRGWGRRNETWHFMKAIRQLGAADWFQLGDTDLAMHVERTRRMAAGESLTAATAALAGALGIHARVLPMSDDPVATRVLTDEGWLEFQDYFVRRRCQPQVRAFEYAGAEHARAQPDAVAALRDPELRAVVLCPSNPFVSIEPILALPHIRAALRDCTRPVIAVTPIIGGEAVKGPAGKMMQELELDVSPVSIAKRYADFIDAFVVDQTDPLPRRLPGVTFHHGPTLMQNVHDRELLARSVLALADRLPQLSAVMR